MGHEVGRADLLLELDEQADVDRQPFLDGQPCADGGDMAVPASDVVAGAAPVETSVDLDRFERRGVPGARLVRAVLFVGIVRLRRQGGLDVGMAVDEESRQVVVRRPLRGEDRERFGQFVEHAPARPQLRGERLEIPLDPPGESQHVVGARPAGAAGGNRRVGDVFLDSLDGVAEPVVGLVDDSLQLIGCHATLRWLAAM